MDPAIIGVMRIGHFRVGVFHDEWERLIQQFETKASLDVTRYNLWLGTRDSVTGWYNRNFSEPQTIKMIIVSRGSSTMGLPVGTYVRTDALGLTAGPVVEGDQIKKGSRYYEVEAVREHYSVGGDSFSYRECDLTLLPFKGLSGDSFWFPTVDDARYNQKVYLETYLRDAYLPVYIVCYGEPDYHVVKVFKQKNVDLVFSVGIPTSSPMLDVLTKAPYGYGEHVPIEVSCIDKSNVDGTKLLWNAVQELRYVTNNYPEGSIRNLREMTPTTQRLGSTILHSQRCIMIYERGTT